MRGDKKRTRGDRGGAHIEKEFDKKKKEEQEEEEEDIEDAEKTTREMMKEEVEIRMG